MFDATFIKEQLARIARDPGQFQQAGVNSVLGAAMLVFLNNQTEIDKKLTEIGAKQNDQSDLMTSLETTLDRLGGELQRTLEEALIGPESTQSAVPEEVFIVGTPTEPQSMLLQHQAPNDPKEKVDFFSPTGEG